jgi:phosphatidylserine/phosphatidylglycerophosphate/cardiolipin synthase-like enzyme
MLLISENMEIKRLVILLLTFCTLSWSHGRATVNNVSVAFSPNAEAEQLVLNGIETAKKSIRVAAYSFTSKSISIALLEAHKKGIAVQIVADAKSAGGQYSAATFLANHGVAVRLNGKYAIFHHKFMVIDNKHIQTGSFNYSSAAANKNAENVIILWDMPKVAEKYIAEWNRLWNEAEQLLPAY